MKRILLNTAVALLLATTAHAETSAENSSRGAAVEAGPPWLRMRIGQFWEVVDDVV